MSFPWPVHSVQETSQNSMRDIDRTRVDGMLHNDDGLSGRGLMTSLGQGKDRSFKQITGNWETAQALRIIGTLATQL